MGVARAGVDPSAMSGELFQTAAADDTRGRCCTTTQKPWASGEQQGIEEGDVVGLLRA